MLILDQPAEALRKQAQVIVENRTKRRQYHLRHRLSDRKVQMVLAGGQIPLFSKRRAA